MSERDYWLNNLQTWRQKLPEAEARLRKYRALYESGEDGYKSLVRSTEDEITEIKHQISLCVELSDR